MANKKQHTSHSDVSMRLKRAKGHLETVIQMIEDERGCLEVARQMHAVANALTEAKRIFIHDHIDHCMDENQLKRMDLEIKEFKEITKYL